MPVPATATIPDSARGFFALSASLPEIFATNAFVLSYELFPPKSPAGLEDLMTNLGPLLEFSPHYITCTYGAGGGTRDKTLTTLAEVRKLYGGPLASHLTCVGMTREETHAYLARAHQQGIDFIVAIRGDKRPDADFQHPVEGGFRYANELVAYIRSAFPDFGIVVGGYPEVHPEAPSPQADMDNLKRKVDAGADVVVTQLFYNNADFFRFRDQCDAAGISVPIVPGLMPVNALKQIQKITNLCGAILPDDFVARLQQFEDDPEAQFEVGVEQATQQTQELVESGVPGIHFYVLNKCRATVRVLGDVHLPA